MACDASLGLATLQQQVIKRHLAATHERDPCNQPSQGLARVSVAVEPPSDETAGGAAGMRKE